MDDHQVRAGDEGFTLLEVVVSLGMLAVIAAAALGFFLSGVRDSTQLQRRQAAVALTNAALEDARSLAATTVTATVNGSTTSYTSLAAGRSSADASAQWAASGLTDSYPAFQPGTTSSAAAAVPLTRPATTVSGQAYTTAVLIGTCYRLRSDLGSACGTSASPTRTTTPPSGYVEMVRVVATTSWKPGAGSTCGAGGCSYSSSVLVDPSADPLWSVSGGEAVDDAANAPKGRTTVLAVLQNDTVVPRATSPVKITAAPAGATAQAQSDGTVKLTLPAAATGTVQFQYAVTSASGGTSNVATVRVTVVDP